MNRPNILPPSSNPEGLADELENQFILRLPASLQECAESLKQTLRTGVMNVKDRLSIKIENDMRKGVVQFDSWVMPAKVKDLPCIIETHKTIDNKTFYKTADVSQIMICKPEGEDQTSSEEETVKPKKKDPHKVDKKFLWPHGIAPPMKNVRKRRFRKTLKKKYVEAPEIEKEVRRLLRVDNEAASVRWELITEEDEAKVKAANEAGLSEAVTVPLATGTFVSNQSRGLAEHEIFGEALSDSDEEHGSKINIMESDDDNSYDSQGSGSEFYRGSSSNRGSGMVTQFSEDMFRDDSSSSNMSPQKKSIESQKDNLRQMAEKLMDEIREIQVMKQSQENELATIENAALRQRFRLTLDKLEAKEQEKREEYNQIMSVL